MYQLVHCMSLAHTHRLKYMTSSNVVHQAQGLCSSGSRDAQIENLRNIRCDSLHQHCIPGLQHGACRIFSRSLSPTAGRFQYTSIIPCLLVFSTGTGPDFCERPAAADLLAAGRLRGMLSKSSSTFFLPAFPFCLGWRLLFGSGLVLGWALALGLRGFFALASQQWDPPSRSHPHLLRPRSAQPPPFLFSHNHGHGPATTPPPPFRSHRLSHGMLLLPAQHWGPILSFLHGLPRLLQVWEGFGDAWAGLWELG